MTPVNRVAACGTSGNRTARTGIGRASALLGGRADPRAPVLAPDWRRDGCAVDNERMRRITHDALVRRLRRAGGVFAEEEAAVLDAAARDGQELEHWCVRREAGELLEQVVGRVELCGERLAVGPGSFVPRQRTALLIDAALAELRGRSRPVLVEAFCGVAPVAAVVGRRLPEVRLHVTDRDRCPLVHARTNLPPTAGVHPGSVLDGLPPGLAGAVDLLVAVPPYVPRAQWELMPRDARENEPRSALVAGEDGLDEVRRLLADAPRWLAPSGVLLIEMHRRQGPAALAAAREQHAYAGTGIVAGEDGQTVLLRAESARAVSSGPAADLVLLRRVRDRIDRDFAEPLDLEELARGVHVSAGHLSRRFREEHGESPTRT